MDWKEELKARIEMCAQAIQDYAEEIAGEYKAQTYLSIDIAPGKPDEAPEVTINRSFIPEDFFKEKAGDEEELKKPVDEYIL